MLHEDAPALRTTLTRILARNGRTLSDRLRLIDTPLDAATLPALVAEHRPAALILSDPAIPPAVLALHLPTLSPLPAQLFLSGRWMEAHHPQAAAMDTALAANGWHGPQWGFDPALTRGYGRVAAPTP